MANPLKTYLEDHYAGSTMAIELLESLRDQPGDNELSELAAKLLTEIKEDQAILRGLIERVGEKKSWWKMALAWIGEKLARVKLRKPAARGLGTFEALETLSLGILGKLALWRALAEISGVEGQLGGIDLDHLASSAQSQHARVEKKRLKAARDALGGACASSTIEKTTLRSN